MKLGFHVSIAGTIDQAVDRARELGCDTFQIFTRNPRSWGSRPLREEEAEAFREKRRRSALDPAFAHVPYIQNLSSPHSVVYERSVASLAADLARCAALDIPCLVTHLGSHLGEGAEMGISRVANAIDRAMEEASGSAVLLLENSSGSGHHIGSRFEDLRAIIERLREPGRASVCFDTCHAFAAGYELRTPEGLEQTLAALEASLGLENLRLVHLNDSVGGLGTGIDHHEHIGLGMIGEQGFRLVLRSRLAELPMIMETPVDGRRSDAENMAKVRQLTAP